MLLSSRSATGVRDRGGSAPHISSSFFAPSRAIQDFVNHPPLPRSPFSPAPLSLSPPLPWLCTRRRESPDSESPFPGPGLFARFPGPCRSYPAPPNPTCPEGHAQASSLRSRKILPSALGRAHTHPGVPSSPQGALSPASAAPPSSPARASRARRQHAPPGHQARTRRASWGRGLWPKLCSLTVFFLATIFSSFLAILSSSSSWPMLAHDARRGEGRRGCGRRKGRGRAQPRGAPNPHDTHACGGRGSPPTPLSARPPLDRRGRGDVH